MNGTGESDCKKGWLKKQGGLVRNWLDRWFVLRGKSLLYFTKEDQSKLQGTIELSGCKLTEIPYNRDEADKWLFEISQVPRGGKANETYLLWADCEAVRADWLGALRRALYAGIGGGVFGGPLSIITKYDKKFHGCDVPHVVKGCVEIILENGKEVEGIFRLSGRVAMMKEMRRRYDEGERPNLLAEDLDIHTAASLLKLYFRELPEPVIPFEHFESFLNLATSFRYNSNLEKTLGSLIALVKVIPTENYRLLDYLTAFLFEISKYQHVNKMTEKNIALIFGTNILRAKENSPEVEMLTQNLTTHVVLALVKHHDKVFGDPNVDIQPTADDEVVPTDTVVPARDEAVEDILNLSDESVDPQPSEAIQPQAVDDLLGIDFTNTHESQHRPLAPPPIPSRAKDTPCDVDTISNDSGVAKDVNSNSCTSLTDSNVSSGHPIPVARDFTRASVTKREGVAKNRNRPAPIIPQSTTPSPPLRVKRKSGSLPVTRVERAESNFTSYIDSPLDARVSLNIGDLPSSADDLQALVLSLKIQLKEKNKANDALTTKNNALEKDNENLTQKIDELEKKLASQANHLSSKIHQARQAKDDALAKVVALTNQLACYQSQYGSVEEDG